MRSFHHGATTLLRGQSKIEFYALVHLDHYMHTKRFYRQLLNIELWVDSMLRVTLREVFIV